MRTRSVIGEGEEEEGVVEEEDEVWVIRLDGVVDLVNEVFGLELEVAADAERGGVELVLVVGWVEDESDNDKTASWLTAPLSLASSVAAGDGDAEGGGSGEVVVDTAVEGGDGEFGCCLLSSTAGKAFCGNRC